MSGTKPARDNCTSVPLADWSEEAVKRVAMDDLCIRPIPRLRHVEAKVRATGIYGMVASIAHLH